MAKRDAESEKDAVDCITHCMYSVGFLKDISDVIFSPNRDRITVGQFYDRWLQARGKKEPVIPFSIGILLAHMYVGILFAKENWFDLVPDTGLTTDATWGLSEAPVVAPKESSPTVKYVVRRIRNSLGHGTPEVNVPQSGLTRTNMLSVVTVTFRDVNVRNPGDTFQAELTLNQVITLVKKLQGEVHQSLLSG